jgi:hypothetical protein
MTKVRVVIDWDTEDDGTIYSPEELELPTEKVVEVDLPKEVVQLIIDALSESEQLNEIVDYLSDKYGWCINSISIGIL